MVREGLLRRRRLAVHFRTRCRVRQRLPFAIPDVVRVLSAFDTSIAPKETYRFVVRHLVYAWGAYRVRTASSPKRQ